LLPEVATSGIFSAAKQRPGAIVSSLASHHATRDLILMPVASPVRDSGEFGDVLAQDWFLHSGKTPQQGQPESGVGFEY
jgi:hypothetical protein